MKSESGRRSQLGMERLEDRDVPASISFPDANGLVTIIGTNSADSVSVKYNATGTKVVITASWGGSVTTAKASVKHIQFLGAGGNDWFQNFTSIPTFAYGGAGNDTIIGGSGDDVLYGGADHDIIYGGNGWDKLYGQQGKDTLYGQGGADYLEGGSEFEVDTLWGGGGIDTFKVSPSYEDVIKDWFVLEQKV